MPQIWKNGQISSFYGFPFICDFFLYSTLKIFFQGRCKIKIMFYCKKANMKELKMKVKVIKRERVDGSQSPHIKE